MDNLFTHKEMIYAIYEEQSFSKAAKRLFVSQPSLSVLVKKLEDQLGMPLFDRSCKPIRLTELGEKYIQAASEIRNIEIEFSNYIGAINDLESGQLNIGANQLLSSYVIPIYISKYIKQHPGVKINLMNDSSPGIDNALMIGDLDFVIDNHELNEDIFINKLLFKEHLLLGVPRNFDINRKLSGYVLSSSDIMANKHLEYSFPCVPLDEFSDTGFIIMTKDNTTRSRTDEILRSFGIKPKILLEVDRFSTLYSFLEAGTAASFVSDTLIKNIDTPKNDSDNICFYKLPDEYSSRNIVLSYKKTKFVSAAMESFISLLKDFN